MKAEFALSPFAVTYLDAVRAIAALTVLFGHLVGLFYIPSEATALSKLIHSVAARSHDAVIVFFVLSGLLITRSAARVFETHRDSWRSYAIARLARLYAVVFPALLLGAAWDSAGLSLFGTGYGTETIPVEQRLTLMHFLANFVFLQEIATSTFGSNQPLWSLAYEGWYYGLFPFLVIAAIGPSKKHRFYAAAVVVLGLCLTGPKISAYFLVWLSGSLLYFLPKPPATWQRYRQAWWVGSLAALPLSIYIARKLLFPMDEAGFWSDALVGVFIAIHLYISMQCTTTLPLWIQRLSSYMAARAFTLYLTHYPLLLFLSFCWGAHASWSADTLHLSLGCLMMASVVFYGLVIVRITEQKTHLLRAKMERLISRRE